MSQAIRDPNQDLLTRIIALEKAIEAVQRLPSGMTSLGIGPLAPPTKAGQPLDGDYQITPPIGTLVWDTASQILWARQSAGVWVGSGGGLLGYAVVTAGQSGITSVTDLTSLTTTVTVGTGRLIRISAIGIISRTVLDGISVLSIKEGGTTLQHSETVPNDISGITESIWTVVAPTAGSHTYKLTLERSTGTGTTGNAAGATAPSFILVEDIGAA